MSTCYGILLLLALATPLVARPAADRPNVVLIYLDDSGFGDYSHNGNPVIDPPTSPGSHSRE